MNREAIENLVIEATRRTDKTTLIRSAINIAVSKVSSLRLWSDLMTENTIAIAQGASTVSLASDVARIIEIRVMDGQQSIPLCVRPKVWFTKRVPDPSSQSQGRPQYGYLQGTTLYLLPYSDDDYDITYTYFRRHPDLSASTDEVLIRCADAAVVAYTIYWVFKSIEKHDDAKEWLNTYNNEARSAIMVDRSNPVINLQADQHQNDARPLGAYWLDPFVIRNP